MAVLLRGLLTMERGQAWRPRPAPQKPEFNRESVLATHEPYSSPAWAQTDGALQGALPSGTPAPARKDSPWAVTLTEGGGQRLLGRQGGRALGSHSDRGRWPHHGSPSRWTCHWAVGQDISVVLPWDSLSVSEAHEARHAPFS